MGEMANTTTEKAPKRSWLKGLKSEFKKIVWPDRDTLTKQSVAVVAITVILGIVIYVLDYVINLGISTIM
ncbi:MAG: putative rane protein [Herbinix sp.]|jgi:preprotein translocase subunit SecE|nr:putative rane protein [Herbinix sp.]